MADPERWLPVRGSEGSYEVSDLGRVRSLARTVPVAATSRRSASTAFIPERILAQCRSPQGFLSLSLAGLGTCAVRGLVCEAFLGPRPAKHLCKARNGLPDDNRVSNLYYGRKVSLVDV